MPRLYKNFTKVFIYPNLTYSDRFLIFERSAEVKPLAPAPPCSESVCEFVVNMKAHSRLYPCSSTSLLLDNEDILEG